MDFNNNVSNNEESEQRFNVILLLATANPNSVVNIESASHIAMLIETEAALRRAINIEKFKLQEWERSKQRVLDEKANLEKLKKIIADQNILLSMGTPASSPTECGIIPRTSPMQFFTGTSEVFQHSNATNSTISTSHSPSAKKRMEISVETSKSTETALCEAGNSSIVPIYTLPAEKKIKLHTSIERSINPSQISKSLMEPEHSKKNQWKSKKSAKQLPSIAQLSQEITMSDTINTSKKLVHQPPALNKNLLFAPKNPSSVRSPSVPRIGQSDSGSNKADDLHSATVQKQKLPKRAKKSKKVQNGAIESLTPDAEKFAKEALNTRSNLTGSVHISAEKLLKPLSVDLQTTLEEPEEPMKKVPEKNLNAKAATSVNKINPKLSKNIDIKRNEPNAIKISNTISETKLHYQEISITKSSQAVKPDENSASTVQEKAVSADKKSTTQEIIKIISSLEEKLTEPQNGHRQAFNSVILQDTIKKVRIAPYASPNRSTPLLNASNKSTASQNLAKIMNKIPKCSAIRETQSSSAQNRRPLAGSSLFTPLRVKTIRQSLPVSIDARTESIRSLIQKKYYEATPSVIKTEATSTTSPSFQIKEPEVSFSQCYRTNTRDRIGAGEEFKTKLSPSLGKPSLPYKTKENIVIDAQMTSILKIPHKAYATTSAETSVTTKPNSADTQSPYGFIIKTRKKFENEQNNVEVTVLPPSEFQNKFYLSKNEGILTPNSSMTIKQEIHGSRYKIM